MDAFIREFSDFVSDIVLKWDRFIIAGDFNIHVCCKSKPYVEDFLNVLDSFSLTQSVMVPKSKGHILDLVLSYGVSVNIEEIYDAGISDHMPVFSFSAAGPRPSSVPARLQRTINSSTASRFSAEFIVSDISDNSFFNSGIDELVSRFDSTCAVILDSIAPLTLRHTKLRRKCRRAERKWKKIDFTCLWGCYETVFQTTKMVLRQQRLNICLML